MVVVGGRGFPASRWRRSFDSFGSRCGERRRTVWEVSFRPTPPFENGAINSAHEAAGRRRKDAVPVGHLRTPSCPRRVGHEVAVPLLGCRESIYLVLGLVVNQQSIAIRVERAAVAGSDHRQTN